ncbi:MAG: hypothetical protein WEB52_00485 [Dehalococcoidia bacterium]
MDALGTIYVVSFMLALMALIALAATVFARSSSVSLDSALHSLLELGSSRSVVA